MPAGAHAPGLRAFAAGFLEELDVDAGPQLVEERVDDVLAAEVELAPVGGLDEAEAFLGHHARDLAVLRRGMDLHLASRGAPGLLEAAAHGPEGVADGD